MGRGRDKEKWKTRILSAVIALAALVLLFSWPRSVKEPENRAVSDRENLPEKNGAEEAQGIVAGTSTSNDDEEIKADPTAPPKKLVIGVSTCLHSGPRTIDWELGAYMADVRKLKPDFIIDLGDFMDERQGGPPHRLALDALSDLDKNRSLFEQYSPRYRTVGNHEALSLDEPDIRSLLGGERFYSFPFGGYTIIVLDTNYKAIGQRITPDDKNYRGFKGALAPEELEWLAGELRAADKAMIFSHHGLYDLRNADKVKAALAPYRDKILFFANGHQHRAKILEFMERPSFDIPSLSKQNAYAVITIAGGKATIVFQDVKRQ